MTSDRSHRGAISVREALDLLQKGADTKYDRRAVRALTRLDRSCLQATDDVSRVGSTTKGTGTASISVKD
jgi:HD-GYP domain-containing protein (c-di-GMP phosphodiesterase class II)